MAKKKKREKNSFEDDSFGADVSSQPVTVAHTRRIMKMYSVLPSEMDTISTFNKFAAGLFSIGSFLISIIWDLGKDICFDIAITNQRKSFEIFLMVVLAIVSLASFGFGIFLWHGKKKLIKIIQKESRRNESI